MRCRQGPSSLYEHFGKRRSGRGGQLNFPDATTKGRGKKVSTVSLQEQMVHLDVRQSQAIPKISPGGASGLGNKDTHIGTCVIDQVRALRVNHDRICGNVWEPS